MIFNRFVALYFLSLLFLFGCSQKDINEEKLAAIYVDLAFLYIENENDSITFYLKRDSVLNFYQVRLEEYENSLFLTLNNEEKTKTFFKYVDSLSETKKKYYLN